MNFEAIIKKTKETLDISSEMKMKIGLLVFSIFLSLLGLELYLLKNNYPFQGCKQIHTSAEYYLGVFDEITGWSYKPKISYYESNNRFSYHFNDVGIRVSSPSSQINYDKPRIVFIGDSVTFGEELNYEDTFAAQIGGLLGDRFEVVNLGVQGYGSDQSLLRLKKQIGELDPSYVVFTFINDHNNRNVNYDRRQHVKCFEFAGTKPLFTVKNNQLTQIGSPKKYIDTDRYKLPLLFQHSWQNFREQVAHKSGFDLKITRAILEEVGATTKRNGAQDFYIFFDTIYNPNSDNYSQFVANEILSDDQLKRTLMFINWAEDSGQKGTKYYANDEDDIHPNASLSALIAKKFVEQFEVSFEAK